MKLNLNLIADSLTGITVRNVHNLYEFPVEYAVLFEGDRCFAAEFLYVVKAEELPEDPVFHGRCSIISLGNVPACYMREDVDLICLAPDRNLAAVFNEISRIIRDYQVWEQKLDRAVIEEKDFRQIGEVIYELVTNPVDLLNVGDRYLLRCYDPDRPENLEYYRESAENGYPSVEELQILYSLPNMMETFTYREPKLLKNDVYGETYLHANLFRDGRYVGKLFFSDAYHPIHDRDYSLIQYLADRLADIVDASNSTVIIHSQEMERIIRKAASGELEYTPAERRYLEKQHWMQHDLYQCAVLACTNEIRHNRQLADHAAFLHSMIPDIYPLVISNGILLVMHGTDAAEFDQKRLRLQQFLIAEKYRCGYGDVFSDFASFSIHFRQAQTALKLGENSGGNSYEFANHILKAIYQTCLDQNELSFYITESLRKLQEYDAANQTEMYRTLRCYLEHGLNIAQTLRVLYIHRSTFNYRIERIEKLLGCSLDNYKTRLYLQFAMEMTEYAENR